LWRRLNWLLIGLIIIINLYVFTAPLIPHLRLWLDKKQTQKIDGLPYKTKLTNTKNSVRAAIPADNRIVIPKIALDDHVFQGTNPHTVDLGVWLRPNTPPPSKGGNTVMVAHRFTYNNADTFYNLDKVSKGDAIVIYWGGKEHDYKVSETKVVAPTAVEIEAPTPKSQLTLYTCTPLWTSKQRLVVIAKPIVSGDIND
jgi:LPXTG-site transpeptidase (sortase) family protein